MSRVTDDAPVWPGHQSPLGVTYDGEGVNVAVWAPDATAITYCRFEENGEETRFQLPEQTNGVWHGYIRGVRTGEHYGLRADGPWDPANGRVFNPAKLLLDPYARAIDGVVGPDDPALSAIDDRGRPDSSDNARLVQRSVVVDPHFDWSGQGRPGVPWDDTVIYEAHVKGLTQLHPDVPERLRGTFAGVGHEATIYYLQDLGVTTLELLPVHHFVSEPGVVRGGLTNYWGYNTIGFFAPHAAYSSAGSRGEQITEFREMVKNLHRAGIEVLLDVVYNHTAEGGQLGPALCFRGIDDAAYYRQFDGRYADVTGCGNTVNASHPQVLQLIMDSLRYWVTEMHVDGFRFDLASALLRNGRSVDLRAPFVTAIHQDPILGEVKLIAEPWDATGEGYLVGQFPPRWCEWNDKYRDAVRDFWRPVATGVHEIASRLSGSSDLYGDDGRLPLASINYVTAHDGFTLRDLVSYSTKHNEPNREDNRDGTNDNRSWNCGTEGDPADPEVRSLRHRQAANLMATLLLSTGVPMIVAGDERGRTQHGNNNAYCQDNETSWIDWRLDPEWAPLLELTKTLIRLRRDHPVLRQPRFFAGTPIGTTGRKDIEWLQPSGQEMDWAAWADGSRTTLGVLIDGDGLRTRSERGEPIHDTSYALWLHAGLDIAVVTLPENNAHHYVEVLRTDQAPSSDPLKPGTTVTLAPHSFAVYETVQ
jgi:isoamylase